MAKFKSRRHSSSNKSSAMVRQSTLIVSVIISLFLGLYIGMFLSDFIGDSGNSVQNNVQAVSTDDHINEAIAIAQENPNDANSWVHLGNIYFDAHMHREAIEAYETALSFEPNNPNVITDKGTMHRALGEFEQAVAAYRLAYQKDPRHENSLFNLGIVLYFDLGRQSEGREVWEQLVRLNPQAKNPNGELVTEMLRNL